MLLLTTSPMCQRQTSLYKLSMTATYLICSHIFFCIICKVCRSAQIFDENKMPTMLGCKNYKRDSLTHVRNYALNDNLDSSMC